MISVCVCCTNSRPDIEMFVRALQKHNEGYDFEVVITHDNRVEDGTTETLIQLQTEFDNIKVVTHTNDHTIDYLSRLINHYEKNELFHPQIRIGMKENLELYKKGKLFNPESIFLWLSSGILYNKAVAASEGNIIVVTPGDFFYMFSLQELEVYINANHNRGDFYASPNAIWARLTNQDCFWLQQHVSEVHKGIGFREGFRWDSIELFRDYLRASSNLGYYYIPDFKRNLLMGLMDESCMSNLREYCIDAMHEPGVQSMPGFHGFHAMTRQTYDHIGGFTEEWYGRAFADDKMTTLGNTQHGPRSLPSQFSVAWCGQHEVLPGLGQGYEPGWQDRVTNLPWARRHPVPPFGQPKYLHDGYIDASRMAQMVNTAFNRAGRPVRT